MRESLFSHQNRDAFLVAQSRHRCHHRAPPLIRFERGVRIARRIGHRPLTAAVEQSFASCRGAKGLEDIVGCDLEEPGAFDRPGGRALEKADERLLCRIGRDIGVAGQPHEIAIQRLMTLLE